MALAERANATRQTFKWLHKQGTPGTPLNVDSPVWKDAAAAPAQAPTAPTSPTAGLRWGAGALAARLNGGFQDTSFLSTTTASIAISSSVIPLCRHTYYTACSCEALYGSTQT
ncbi:unnamed protein product [Pleuronectes platessa]|uniref:Uncharacterized protein n=1 Tax=Pleuronectes platessa TaxID=8262 RepID=A0A9N7VV53_PLEPL|nr:unnamed protein product [Pleuronectes platessa]